MKKFIMGAAAAVLIFAAILLTNLHFDKNVYITEYTYASEKVPAEFDGYKAALISDMHNSKYADRQYSYKYICRNRADRALFKL